jgi:hypothetical protein
MMSRATVSVTTQTARQLPLPLNLGRSMWLVSATVLHQLLVIMRQGGLDHFTTLIEARTYLITSVSGL